MAHQQLNKREVLNSILNTLLKLEKLRHHVPWNKLKKKFYKVRTSFVLYNENNFKQKSIKLFSNPQNYFGQLIPKHTINLR